MSTIYYIVPYPPESWRNPDDVGGTSELKISFKDFMDRMKESFITEVSPPFSWVLLTNEKDGEIDVSGSIIGEERQIIGLTIYEGSQFARFVKWYRSYVSQQYPLYLFPEGQWSSLEITHNTSLNEIEQYVGLA